MCFKRKEKIISETTKSKVVSVYLSDTTNHTLNSLASNLINGHPLIIDFSKIEREDANRALAFLSGVAFTLDGNVSNIKDMIFLFTDKNSFADGTLRSYIKDLF